VLRDLRADAVIGRCYVPRTWLTEHALAPEWLLGNGPPEAYRPDGAVSRLCGHLARLARDEFVAARAALRGLPLRERRALVPARTMAAIYADLLRCLELRGGDLASSRRRIARGRKVLLALSVWAGLRW
jgi:phytoene/squalene synthetase